MKNHTHASRDIFEPVNTERFAAAQKCTWITSHVVFHYLDGKGDAEIYFPAHRQSGEKPAHCRNAVTNRRMTMNYFVFSGLIRVMHKISAQATATRPILVQIFCAPYDKLMAQCRSDTYEKLARFLRLKIPVFSLFNLIVIFLISAGENYVDVGK